MHRNTIKSNQFLYKQHLQPSCPWEVTVTEASSWGTRPGGDEETRNPSGSPQSPEEWRGGEEWEEIQHSERDESERTLTSRGSTSGVKMSNKLVPCLSRTFVRATSRTARQEKHAGRRLQPGWQSFLVEPQRAAGLHHSEKALWRCGEWSHRHWVSPTWQHLRNAYLLHSFSYEPLLLLIKLETEEQMVNNQTVKQKLQILNIKQHSHLLNVVLCLSGAAFLSCCWFEKVLIKLTRWFWGSSSVWTTVILEKTEDHSWTSLAETVVCSC